MVGPDNPESETGADGSGPRRPLVEWAQPEPRRGPRTRRQTFARVGLVIAMPVLAYLLLRVSGGMPAQERPGVAAAIGAATWERLSEGQQSAFEARLLTALGNPAPESPGLGLRLQQAVGRGLPKLADRFLVRRLDLVAEGLRRAPIEPCAAFGRAVFAGARVNLGTAEQIVQSPEDEQLVQWYGILVAAVEADAFGTRTPRIVSDDESTAMTDRMYARFSADSRATIAAGVAPSAEPKPVCAAVRLWYSSLNTLSDEDRALAANLDVSASP